MRSCNFDVEPFKPLKLPTIWVPLTAIATKTTGIKGTYFSVANVRLLNSLSFFFPALRLSILWSTIPAFTPTCQARHRWNRRCCACVAMASPDFERIIAVLQRFHHLSYLDPNLRTLSRQNLQHARLRRTARGERERYPRTKTPSQGTLHPPELHPRGFSEDRG